MFLYIDTSNKKKTCLKIKNGKKEVDKKEITNKFDQAEKLLPNIKALLDKNSITKNELKKIYVNSQGDSFTSLSNCKAAERSGVTFFTSSIKSSKVESSSSSPTEVSREIVS